MASSKNRGRVAENFISRYGKPKFERLIAALAAGESGQRLAEEFDVSRERVRQWKNTFGRVITLYQVHPDVQAILDEGSEPEPTTHRSTSTITLV